MLKRGTEHIIEHMFCVGVILVDLLEKLTILADAAKYDVACTSSGVNRKAQKGGIGSTASTGICHSFSADGRCISLLKVLLTNHCIYDCKYCLNRVANDTKRVAFTPRELADLTIQFYRRNYIEGLFLSSGILRNPDYTCEQLLRTLTVLRKEYHFQGYIHVKAIPGAQDRLIQQLGFLADRMSINIELPSQESLKLLAPDKTKHSILGPMHLIQNGIQENRTDLMRYKYAPDFVPAGQSTQMIVGATGDTDYQILTLTQSLYRKYGLKRVFFSAYTPLQGDALLPSLDTKPPLLREHRLYQADWLLRFYGFHASELLDKAQPNFNPYLDPKCNWALRHMNFFPVEVNTADYEMLLRVPGIGVKSARRIMIARRNSSLDAEGLKKIGVVLKRAQYFITCQGKQAKGLSHTPEGIAQALLSKRSTKLLSQNKQFSLFSQTNFTEEDVAQCLTGEI